MNTCLRKVSKENCDLLFRWTNDEEVRKNSFNCEKISYENHVKWFNSKLDSQTCHIFIFYKEHLPVGQIRLDELTNGEALISYSVAKEFRGQGLAKEMVDLLENMVKDDFNHINRLVARVKYNNLPSQKIFKKLNYVEAGFNDYLEYKKDL